MSLTHGHSHVHEALAEANGDPTRTKTLRRRYAQNLRGELADLNTVIRRGVADRDVFGLQAESLVEELPVFRFTTDDKKVSQFMAWLRKQERRGVLRVITRNDNTYIRSAYQSGLTYADARLREQGVTVPESSLQQALTLPVHRDAVQMIYTRNFNELQGITEVMNQQISRELAEGFAQGKNPRTMARAITNRIDKIGKTRATTLAKTEIIRGHSEATLNRFEQLGVDEVTIKAEWTTAGDRRVCPICATLEGKTYTIQEAREETFSYSAGTDEPSSLSGTYPVRPPAHPNCRCALSPKVAD